jgi:hypothetical protein
LLFFLAGCQTAGEKAVAPVAGIPSSGAPSAETPVAPPAAVSGTATGLGEASKPQAAETKARAVRFTPEEFIGFSPERVLPILGAPDFVRRDGSAQIWQYRAPDCVLDLFLYQAGSETHVKHAELRSRVPNAESIDSCYSRMRQERKGKPAG